MTKKRKNTKGGGKSKNASLNSSTSDASSSRKPTRASSRKKTVSERRSGSFSDDYHLRNSVESDGLDIVDMHSDGNCLFRSLSDQLYGDYGSRHDEVRSDICDFMEENKDDFQVFLVFEDDGEEDEDAEDFESYLSNMRQDGEWGGNLELVAAAKLYCRKITVFSAALDAYTIDHGEPESSGPDLLVSFHDNDHYNSVRDAKAPTNPPVKKVTPKKKSKLVASKDRDQKFTSQISDSTVSTATTLSELSVENGTGKPRTAKPPKRSAPCPCGSGLRYKKCCLAKQKHLARVEKMNTERGECVVSADEDETPQEVDMKGNFRVLHI